MSNICSLSKTLNASLRKICHQLLNQGSRLHLHIRTEQVAEHERGKEARNCEMWSRA